MTKDLCKVMMRSLELRKLTKALAAGASIRDRHNYGDGIAFKVIVVKEHNLLPFPLSVLSFLLLPWDYVLM